MYDVSSEYMQAISSVSFREDIKGVVGNVAFGIENILKGTFTLTNQCCGASTVEIGQVYVGELDCTFVDLSIPRKDYKNLTIVPQHGVWIESRREFEYIPLGIYTIDKAEWTQKGISVVAYDNMSKFDKTFSITSTNGFPYDFLRYCCDRCGVTLGMTKAQVEALPNGKENFDLYEEVNDIKTYRDFLSWVAQTTATNAMISRDGKLFLRAYDNVPIDAIDNYRRLRNGKITDFETFYTGLSIVNIEQKTTSYYGLAPDNGLTYNLGQNPLMQYGLDETKERQRRTILESIAIGIYTPCDFSLMQPPIYDLMDCITLSGGIVDDETLTCVLKYDWKFGGTYKFECVGQDPSLASVQSKVDKNIAGLLEAVQKDNSTFYVYGFENSEEYSIGTIEQQVTTIDFATVDTSRVVFIFQCNCELTKDSLVIADLYLDQELYDTFKMYYPRGAANIMFSWFHDLTAGLRHELTVKLRVEYFESDRRIDEANIKTLKNYVDATVFYMSRQSGTWGAISIYNWNYVAQYVWNEIYSEDTGIGYQTWNDVLTGGLAISPQEISYNPEMIDTETGTIEVGIAKIKSVMFGRGLAATDVWDGSIDVFDSTEIVDILKPYIIPLMDSVETARHYPMLQMPHDRLVDVSIPTMLILNTVNDSIANVSEREDTNFGNKIKIWCTNSTRMSDVIRFENPIYSIEFNTSIQTTFAVSNDGGTTWFIWNGTLFERIYDSQTVYADAGVMSNIPMDSWNAFEVDGLRFKWSQDSLGVVEPTDHINIELYTELGGE